MTDERKCPYLPDRLTIYEEYLADVLSPELYGGLISMGFRRSGRIVYRPLCRKCSECMQMRIRVEQFRPSRSMKRVIRLNEEVQVSIGRPEFTLEKYELFIKYLDIHHDSTMSRNRESFQSFMYDSPAETLEIIYRAAGRIMGISIADMVADGLSSVYMFFDPDFSKRSPGTFSILQEIDLCSKSGLPYYYLGYLVNDCPKMKYKARFRPFELLNINGTWEEGE